MSEPGGCYGPPLFAPVSIALERTAHRFWGSIWLGSLAVIGGKVAVQPVRRDTQAMMAVHRNLVFASADRLDPVDPHEAANPALADIKASLLEFHSHPGTTVTAKAQAILFPNMGQHSYPPAPGG